MTRTIAALTLILATLPARADDLEISWANKLFQPTNTQAVVLHDFGVVPHGTMLVKRYAVTNPYQVPLAVEVRPPSCSCVAARFTKQALQPLESGELVVTMDANRFTENRAVNLPIYFHSGDNHFFSTASLRFQAYSRRDVTLGKPGFLQFGTVAQREAVSQSIEVIYTGDNAQWKIEDVAANDGPTEVTITPLERTRSQAVYRLTAKLKPDAPDGTLDSRIQLRTNDSSNPLISVNVVGTVQAPFSIIGGSKIVLPATEVGGEPTSKTVIIRGSKPFQVQRVEGARDGLKVEVMAIPARPIQSFALRFEPSATGTLKQELKVLLSTGDTLKLEVEAAAVAK